MQPFVQPIVGRKAQRGLARCTQNSTGCPVSQVYQLQADLLETNTRNDRVRRQQKDDWTCSPYLLQTQRTHNSGYAEI